MNNKPTIADVIRSSKAGVRHSAEDMRHLKRIADHVDGIGGALKALGLDNGANSDNASNAETAGKARKTITFKAVAVH